VTPVCILIEYWNYLNFLLLPSTFVPPHTHRLFWNLFYLFLRSFIYIETLSLYTPNAHIPNGTAVHEEQFSSLVLSLSLSPPSLSFCLSLSLSLLICSEWLPLLLDWLAFGAATCPQVHGLHVQLMPVGCHECQSELTIIPQLYRPVSAKLLPALRRLDLRSAFSHFLSYYSYSLCLSVCLTDCLLSLCSLSVAGPPTQFRTIRNPK
jgi:hypothetical protein